METGEDNGHVDPLPNPPLARDDSADVPAPVNGAKTDPAGGATEPSASARLAAAFPEDHAVEVVDVSKRFGDTRAVAGVRFGIARGEMFGFIGPNGAGKTTTIKMIATLIQPDMGVVRVMGNNVRLAAPAVRRAIGYMPDFLGAYPELTVWEFMDFFGATYGMRAARRKRVIAELFELVDLSNKARELVG